MTLILQSLLDGLIAGSIYALFATGLTLIYGTLHFINFAHGELIMAGAYLAYLFMIPPLGFSPFLSAGLAVLGIIGLALLMDKAVFRPLRNASPLLLLIASLGISLFLQNLAQAVWGAEIRTFPFSLERGLSFGPVVITRVQITILFVAAATILFLYLLLKFTRAGKAIRGVSDNPRLAETFGVESEKIIRNVWILAAALAAVGGVLYAADTNLEPHMGIINLVRAFAAVLLGGTGNVWGALIGGFVIGLSENLGVLILPLGYKDAIAFFIIIILLLFRPEGILGTRWGVR